MVVLRGRLLTILGVEVLSGDLTATPPSEGSITSYLKLSDFCRQEEGEVANSALSTSF
jgi:hypothetical protein